MKLMILNLSRRTTEAQLRDLFSPFGVVDACNLVMDVDKDKSKGFGFVEMPNKDEANRALEALNKKRVQTKRIKVKEAN
jgi:RNA recognition motif-containing protein